MTNLSDRELLEVIAQQGYKTFQKVEILEQKVDKLEQRLDKLEETVQENHGMFVTLAEDFKSLKDIVNEHVFYSPVKEKIGIKNWDHKYSKRPVKAGLLEGFLYKLSYGV